MEKRCFSVQSADFEKTIKAAFNKDKIKKIYEKIKDLEDLENDRDALATDKKSQRAPVHGKTLSKMEKKNIYVLEVGTDRFMAVIIEKDNKKIYAWFWGGSHESYNHKIKTIGNLNQVENTVIKTQKNAIEEGIVSLKSKEQVTDKIKEMHQEYGQDKPKGKFKPNKKPINKNW